MGPTLKQGFKSKKQTERYKNVSIASRMRGESGGHGLSVLNDHSYASPTNKDNPPIGVVEELFSTDTDNSWSTGRRIVELGVLAEGLSGCKKCGLPLQLAHASDIVTCGLSAIIKVKIISFCVFV